MVPPSQNPDQYVNDEWVVKVDSDSKTIAEMDSSYHFLIEEEGYLINKGN